MSQLTELAKLVTAVLRRVLVTRILMDSLQQSNKDTRKKSVDDYFLKQLFYQSVLPHSQDYDLDNGCG
jgi:hypothetical protein